ncbi:hypothetical protein Tco_0092515 [Tanacetum coccineum]
MWAWPIALSLPLSEIFLGDLLGLQSRRPNRECMPFFLSPNHVKMFLSLAPSLVNTMVLIGLLWRVELDSSFLSLEKTLGLRPGRVFLDVVYGLGLRLFLVLLFLSHDSDSESWVFSFVCAFRRELSP